MGLAGADVGNYVDVAMKMRTHALDPQAEMAELFRRMAFNVLIQNTDDHLRNLGFLYAGRGKWRLSPAFDVNPVPGQGATLKTAISEIHGNALDVDAVIDAAVLFDVGADEAGFDCLGHGVDDQERVALVRRRGRHDARGHQSDPAGAGEPADRAGIGAINRFKIVVTQYQTTRHVEEALMRLAESSKALGIRHETQTRGRRARARFPRQPLV